MAKSPMSKITLLRCLMKPSSILPRRTASRREEDRRFHPHKAIVLVLHFPGSRLPTSRLERADQWIHEQGNSYWSSTHILKANCHLLIVSFSNYTPNFKKYMKDNNK